MTIAQLLARLREFDVGVEPDPLDESRVRLWGTSPIPELPADLYRAIEDRGAEIRAYLQAEADRRALLVHEYVWQREHREPPQ